MTNIKILSSVNLITAAQALEKLWDRVPSMEVKVALKSWRVLADTKGADSLYQLNNEQLAEFLDFIPDLLLILYTQNQEAQKGDDHES